MVANDKFLHQFNLKEEDILEQSFMEIVHNQWKTAKLDQLLLEKDTAELFIQHEFQGAGIKDIFVKTQPVTMDKSSARGLSIITFKNKGNEQGPGFI